MHLSGPRRSAKFSFKRLSFSGLRTLVLHPGLNAKLVLIVVLTSLVGVLVSSALVLTLQRQQLIDSALGTASQLSSAVQANLEHAMLLDDPVMMNQIVETMIKRQTVEHIRILDAQGIVQVSSRSAEVGNRYSLSDPTCQGCHAGATRPAGPSTIITTSDNHEELLSVNLIYNQPRCQGCHSPQQKILGLTLFEMPLTELNSQLAAGFSRIVVAALFAFVLLIALMTFALERLIFRPVRELDRAAREIRGGNLDYPLRASTHDELGNLAEAFDSMRARLKFTRRENSLLLAETRRREQEATALHRLTAQISSSLEMSQVLNAIAAGACEILHADIGAVALVDESRRRVRVMACCGNRTDLWRDLAIPLNPAGSNDDFTQPVCIEDWSADLPVPRAAELIRGEGIASSLAAPMWNKGRLYGYVGVMTRRHRHCSKEEIELFMRLALQVVAAIENAELYQKEHYLAVLEERDRLACEMHDNLAQTLGYLNIQMALTDELLAKPDIARARAQLHELKAVVQGAYTDVREAIFHLRRPISTNAGLVPILQEYIAEFRAHYGIEAQLRVADPGLARFPPEVEAQVNRIIQEALTNVHKHAAANRVCVRFEREQQQVRISIEDNGKGFDPSADGHGGAKRFGLQIMRERAESVGGELAIDSQAGAGTRITVHVPIFPIFEAYDENS